MGAALMRGGLTRAAGSVSSPAKRVSSSPAGSAALDWFMASRSAQVDMLQTNSPWVSQLATVSFLGPSGRGPPENITMGGFSPQALK